ncbi:MAG: hypothetical protein ACMUHU_01915 [Thermoplasmatota archaeon]
MKLLWLAPIILVAAVAFSGCLGGESKGESEPDYIVQTDGMELAGSQTGLAQATPTEVFIVVPIQLDFETVIKLQVNISVEDNDEGTNPDQVGAMELREVVTEGEANSTNVNGGNTPVTQQIVVEWKSPEYLSSNWELYIPVTLNGGEDTWPGPFIWRGVPDRGFSYSLEITYEYHSAEE